MSVGQHTHVWPVCPCRWDKPSPLSVALTCPTHRNAWAVLFDRYYDAHTFTILEHCNDRRSVSLVIPPVVSEHATRWSTISNRQQGFICGSDHTVEIWFSEVPLLCWYFTNCTLQSPHSWYSTAYIHDIHFETVTQRFPPLVCVLHWCRPPHPRQSADISFYSAQKATKSCTVLHSAVLIHNNAV